MRKIHSILTNSDTFNIFETRWTDYNIFKYNYVTLLNNKYLNAFVNFICVFSIYFSKCSNVVLCSMSEEDNNSENVPAVMCAHIFEKFLYLCIKTFELQFKVKKYVWGPNFYILTLVIIMSPKPFQSSISF